MKVVGLITEYNPFHKGHQIHIEQSKAITGADYCVVVMSGNYVQRGEPAIIDKWSRTRIALSSGADMVIEIPVHYATASAEFFAAGSVALLNATGIVDSLCFGSEQGSLEPLEKAAHFLTNETPEYKSALNEALDKGLRYPVARAQAMKEFVDHSVVESMATSNNILGIEYLKALYQSNSSIHPYTIQRQGAGYHDQNMYHLIASATAIRKHLSSSEVDLEQLKKMVPENCYHILKNTMAKKTAPLFFEDFFSLLQYQLTMKPGKTLSQYADVTEGLENRFVSAVSKSTNLKELLQSLETKRYTKTKINRALLHCLLELEQTTLDVFNQNGYAQYLKVLGFRQESQPLMKALKNHAALPLIVNVKDTLRRLTSLQEKMLTDEIRATDIYNIALLNKYGTKLKNEYTQPLIILKSQG